MLSRTCCEVEKSGLSGLTLLGKRCDDSKPGMQISQTALSSAQLMLRDATTP